MEGKQQQHTTVGVYEQEHLTRHPQSPLYLYDEIWKSIPATEFGWGDTRLLYSFIQKSSPPPVQSIFLCFSFLLEDFATESKRGVFFFISSELCNL